MTGAWRKLGDVPITLAYHSLTHYENKVRHGNGHGQGHAHGTRLWCACATHVLLLCRACAVLCCCVMCMCLCLCLCFVCVGVLVRWLQWAEVWPTHIRTRQREWSMEYSTSHRESTATKLRVTLNAHTSSEHTRTAWKQWEGGEGRCTWQVSCIMGLGA